jgi:hypothetical protein
MEDSRPRLSGTNSAECTESRIGKIFDRNSDLSVMRAHPITRRCGDNKDIDRTVAGGQLSISADWGRSFLAYAGVGRPRSRFGLLGNSVA